MVRVENNYIGSSEAARILGIHHFAVQRLLRSGRIPGEKIANRWLIPRTAVEEFAKTYEPRVGAPTRKRKYTKRGEKWVQK